MRVLIVIILILMIGLFILSGCGPSDFSNNRQDSDNINYGPDDDEEQDSNEIPSPPSLPEG